MRLLARGRTERSARAGAGSNGRSRRLVIVALVALLCIGITVDADRTAVSFTATTDNPGNAVGDVITFTLPDRLITHRVVGIAHDEAGLQLTTKGDANEAAAPMAIRAGSAIGAVRLSVPLAGYAVYELQRWWRAAAATIALGIALDAARRRLVLARSSRNRQAAAAAA